MGTVMLAAARVEGEMVWRSTRASAFCGWCSGQTDSRAEDAVAVCKWYIIHHPCKACLRVLESTTSSFLHDGLTQRKEPHTLSCVLCPTRASRPGTRTLQPPARSTA